MGNADAETQGLADAVAPTNDKDGVAWALIKYILEAPDA